ncbi:hypothetical protein QTN25_002226 [Entamoeba marina]
MEKVIESIDFIQFKNDLNEFMKKINDVKDEVNVDVRTKYNLEKYEQIIEGSDKDVLTQYETWYDQLAEVVINNNNTIKQRNKLVQQIEELNNFFSKAKEKFEEINENMGEINGNMKEITNTEIENNDKIKATLNLLVYKMIDNETIIFNKQEQNIKNEQNEKQIEFNKQTERLEKEKQNLLMKLNIEKEELEKESDKRRQQFNEKLKELNNMKYQYRNADLETFSMMLDKENIYLNPSINKLKEWSGKQKCSIIFDSKIDGDGGNNVLHDKVINKKNLYFISFDNENNVFGGYLDTTIGTVGNITDSNAFTFSLIRNGEFKNIKYEIKNDCRRHAFYLCFNSDCLYNFGSGFGNDISVCRIGNSNSHCFSTSYEYNGEQHPFIDNTDSSNYFTVKRLLVMEMN